MYDYEELKKYIEKALLAKNILIKQYYLEKAYFLLGGKLETLEDE